MKDNPFRSSKIHGYKKIKRDNSYNLLQSIPYIAFWIIMARVLLVFAMLLVAEYSPDIKGFLDFVYHFTDNVAWFTIGVFLFIYHKTRIGLNFHMHLEKLSRIASILAGLNVIGTLAYGMVLTRMHYWQGVYYAFELAIWVVITLFFHNYWKHCKRTHSHNRSEKEQK